ncbi:GDSL-type esterase/lipase family protein [Reyranella sp.]|jgi:lysophospholipase L1-like esterase|uniref:GDSL-type esterase/lipase family protein n=1 Tax=Reyranella sp. TaxID=1929291 RepID=UPI002F95B20D
MRICFVGDSMVNGTGDPAYLGWVGRVLQDERRRGIELTGYNLGVRRDRSDQIRARWRAEVEARLPAEFEGRVVFSFGANDAVQEIPSAATLGHAEAILAEARACWPVFMVGVVPIETQGARGRCGALDRAFASLCDRLGVPFVSVFDGLMATPVWRDEVRAGDGAHPAAGGYNRMAEIVLASSAWQRWIRSAA